jgi:hypothetical protein
MWQLLVLCFLFVSPMLIYVWIVSVHRLSNIREIVSALHTMTLPVVNEYPRCRHYNATHFKCLPNTFLIGASKCGTTTLLEYLTQLPDVALVSRRISAKDHHREVHRFDRNTFLYAWKFLELADEWASSPIVRDPNAIVVHYTPHYLYAPTVPFEMREFYPDDPLHKFRFIVMLRDPVARALSAYWFSRSHLFGSKTDRGSIQEFTSLVEEQMKSREKYDRCLIENDVDFHSRSPFHAGSTVAFNMDIKEYSSALSKCFGSEWRSPRLGDRHIDKSIYVDQLHRWFANFPPSEIESNRRGAALPQDERFGAYFVSALEVLASPVTQTQMLTQLLDFLYKDRGMHIVRPKGTPALPAQGYLVKPNAHAQTTENAPSEALLQKLRAFYAPYTEQVNALLKEHASIPDIVLSK